MTANLAGQESFNCGPDPIPDGGSPEKPAGKWPFAAWGKL